MTWLARGLGSICRRADIAAGDAVRARAADILRPAGALARFDEVAAWVAEWQRTTDPAVRRPAALDLRCRSRRHRGRCQQVPRRRDCGDARGLSGRQVDGQRLRRRCRSDGRGDRRRRRQADRRHPHRVGDVRRPLRRGRSAGRTPPSTRSTPTCWCWARWASATPLRPPQSPLRWAAARSLRGSAAAPVSTTRADPQARRGARRRRSHRRRARSAGGAARGRRRRTGGDGRGDRRGTASAPAGADRRLRGHCVGVAAARRRAPTRWTTAWSATARPSPATDGCWNASASSRCSISGCASAKGRGPWPRSRWSPWPAPASPTCRRSPNGSADESAADRSGTLGSGESGEDRETTSHLRRDRRCADDSDHLRGQGR